MGQLRPVVFCSKHTDCEAPISVITEILSGNDQEKFEIISETFDKFNITKVKDLAKLDGAAIRNVDSYSILLLYGAIRIYSERQDNLLKSAKSELEKGNFINTQKICQILLTHKPTDLNVILVNAASFFHSNNYEECIDWLEKAKIIKPRCPEVLSNLALVYMKKSENVLAKKYMTEVCELKPLCVKDWSIFAAFLLEIKDLHAAEMCYAHVLNLNPKLYEIRNKYGLVLLHLNKTKEAKKQFKIAHHGMTDCQDSLYNLGRAYYFSNKYSKAIIMHKKNLEINPDQARVYDSLGLAHLKVNEYQNAFNAFIKATKLEPKNVAYLHNLAITYCHQEKMELCVEIYKKCLELRSEQFDLNFQLAQVYLYNIKNYGEAIFYLKKCIQLNPDNMEVYEKLYMAYMKSNDNLNASDVCIIIGDLNLKMNDQKSAEFAFFYATKVNPENAFGHWKFAVRMYNLGNLKSALERFKFAVESKPNLLNVMMWLTSDIQMIKDKMQWCSSWWCPKHGYLKQYMQYLNPETPKEQKEELSLVMDLQKHWTNTTEVKCSVFDRKSETDRYLVPPAGYPEYLRDLVKTGDSCVQSGYVADMAAAASARKSFLQSLEEILSSSN